MANNVASLTGAIANMAAIEAEFQANWDELDFMKAARRPNCFIRTNLAAGQTLRLWIRSASADGSGTPVWTQSAAGVFTVPAKVTTGGDEWTEARFVVGEEWGGLLVSSSAACTVQIWTSDAM